MNILVTGSNGQLGSELKDLSKLYPQANFLFTDIHDLDITNKIDLKEYGKKNDLQIIINCAAYTAVDKAEEEPERAYLINVEAVNNLIELSNEQNAHLIHISTDYVFGGEGFRPYKEDHQTNAQSVYAKSKLDGENQIIAKAKQATIIRTSWLYSQYGHNFVKTMIKYGTERPKLRVVFDQIGTPTYAHDLAEAIIKIILNTEPKNKIEIYHYSNEGVCSWYDFSKAIMEEKKIPCEVEPILSSEYPLPAMRPYYSVLDKTKIKEQLKITIPHWRESLKICLLKLRE